MDVSTAGDLGAAAEDASTEASATDVFNSVSATEIGPSVWAVLVGDFVLSSRNANSGSSTAGSSRFFATEVFVLNAHFEDFLGVAFALNVARCTEPLIDFDDRAAALWQALHTKFDDNALARYISMDFD